MYVKMFLIYYMCFLLILILLYCLLLINIAKYFFSCIYFVPLKILSILVVLIFVQNCCRVIHKIEQLLPSIRVSTRNQLKLRLFFPSDFPIFH